MTIQKLLQNSDKADFMNCVQKHIGGATKALIVLGIPNPSGGLDLKARQMGFKYLYELQGFFDWIAEHGLGWSDDCDEEEIDR